MSDNKLYEEALQQANDKGYESLSPEQLAAIKYHSQQETKEVNSDDYSEAQIRDIKERLKHGEKVTPEERAAVQGKKLDEQSKVLDIVIHGVNDLFMKHYDFKEDKVSFDISIRMPNIREQGRVFALVSSYTGGAQYTLPDYWYKAYYALSLLRVCGVDVPKQLASDDTLYPVAAGWLVTIYNDWSNWEQRFRY